MRAGGAPTTVREEVDERTWDAFVQRHTAATQYHRWVWRTVVGESFGHPTHYLAAWRGGDVVGILPLVLMRSRLFGRFLVSMPFFNYGGLLVDDPEAGRALLNAAEALGRQLGVGFVELRHLEPSPLLDHTRTHKVTMLLDLDRDADRMWRGFDAKLRNQIRKAQKSGLTAITGGPELVGEFYDVFAQNMRDLGTPVYARRFFDTMLRHLGGTIRILVVRLGGRPVAAGILLRFRGTLEVPWASSIRHYNALCPNNLLYWEALQWAAAEGIRRFDFGRSTPEGGTYRFKLQWGARPVPLYWQYRLVGDLAMPDLSPGNPRFRLAVEVWRRLPLGLTRWLGPRIVRYLP